MSPRRQSRLVWMLAILAGGVCVAACEPGPTPAPTASPPVPAVEQGQGSRDEAHRLREMVDQWFDEYLEANPWYATSIGDHRFDDRLEIDIGAEYRGWLQAICERYLEQAGTIERSSLSPEDLVTLELFERDLRGGLEGLQYPTHRLPFDHYNSTPTAFAELGSGNGTHPFRTTRDYENFLSRIDDFVVWTRVAMDNMRQGMRDGIVQPRFVVELMIDQMRQFDVDRPEDSVFYGPVADFPDTVQPAERQRLEAAYGEAIMHRLRPAYVALADFLETVYLPAARESVGYGALPGGDDWYEWRVRYHTTTGLTAEQIHRIGQDEVARILGEMEEVRRRIGFEGELEDFLVYMRTDPRFRWASGEEMLEAYRAVEARVAAGVPRLFGVSPKAGFEIRPVEAFRAATAASASYRSPSEDGTRPGIFFLNIHDLSRQVRWGVETLFLHEAIPGHHFQGALALENRALPRFRRLAFVTAFTEGWALYSEDLGQDLGLFDDPHQYFGKLNDEMLRAARLVVDTGIHRLGWSRRQAADYMRRNSSMPESEIMVEVDRYAVHPGQALAYKIGQLELMTLRSEARRRLGERFDLRDWHDFILGMGEVPMDVLRRANDVWIERSGPD